MKTVLFAVIIGLLIFITACGKNDKINQGVELSADISDKSAVSSVEYDIDKILSNQKIVFIMSVSSFEDPYAAGYFIDQQGKKHIYGLYDQRPFESIEKEYSYLIEHYDEFETTDFFDYSTLRKCTEYLYRVNAESEIRTEGKAIIDAPEKQLYGVRMLDDHEEFVWLGSEPGISKRLDDASSDHIFEEFGDKWYLIK